MTMFGVTVRKPPLLPYRLCLVDTLLLGACSGAIRLMLSDLVTIGYSLVPLISEHLLFELCGASAQACRALGRHGQIEKWLPLTTATVALRRTKVWDPGSLMMTIPCIRRLGLEKKVRISTLTFRGAACLFTLTTMALPLTIATLLFLTAVGRRRRLLPLH